MRKHQESIMNVVITGANRGIGLELARIFKDRGANVIAACRSRSAELEQLGADIRTCDVADPASVASFASALGETPVHVLVNNAGVLSNESLDDLDEDRIRHQLEINALGPLRVTQALRKNLASGGKVAIVTSRMGSIDDNTSGGMYGYRMSKAAVNQAGKSLANDLKPDGVHVVLLHPGFVQTGMTGNRGHITPDVAAQGLVARIDELDASRSGRFFHQNGEELPW
jgi:NAD(P)-dependent dehydrogenase (short-subunit alcohol dehydrogenase family)